MSEEGWADRLNYQADIYEAREEGRAEARADAEATLRKRESELETLFAAAHAAVTYRNERTLDNLAATMLYLPQPPKADAEATIQRLREALERPHADWCDIVRNPRQSDAPVICTCGRDSWVAEAAAIALADTAPEGER